MEATTEGLKGGKLSEAYEKETGDRADRLELGDHLPVTKRKTYSMVFAGTVIPNHVAHELAVAPPIRLKARDGRDGVVMAADVIVGTSSDAMKTLLNKLVDGAFEAYERGTPVADHKASQKTQSVVQPNVAQLCDNLTAHIDTMIEAVTAGRDEFFVAMVSEPAETFSTIRFALQRLLDKTELIRQTVTESRDVGGNGQRNSDGA